MKVGDLVTSYWKGYYEIVKIERRWENKNYSDTYGKQAYSIVGEYTPDCGEEMNSLISMTQKFSAEGKPLNIKKVKTCDVGFCKPAKQQIEIEINRLGSVIDNLKNILIENIGEN